MHANIVSRLEEQFPNGEIEVHVDGNRASIQVIADSFAGMTRVKRQQSVYACLNDLIQSGELHAVTIDARAPTED